MTGRWFPARQGGGQCEAYEGIPPQYWVEVRDDGHVIEEKGAVQLASGEPVEVLKQGGIGATGEEKNETFLVSSLRAISKSPARLALAYLIALSVAEVCTVLIEPRIGLVLHGVLLVTLVLHAALTWEQRSHQLLLCLVFAPLIRILSLSIPMAGFPQVYWYLITSVPLFAAAIITRRNLGFSWAWIGVTMRRWPIQVLVGLTGVLFGYVEYMILRPKPLASRFTWEDLLVPALILLVCTGLLEEFIFRGLMQRAATEVLGRFGMIYVAVLFAVLHVGYRSVLDVLFVFGVGLFFGWAVSKTGSILGVTLSHGFTNILLFLVVPFLIQPLPAALPIGQGLPPAVVPTPAVTVSFTPTPPITWPVPSLPMAALSPSATLPTLPTATPTATGTATTIPSATRTLSLTPTATPTATPTERATVSPTQTASPTRTPAPSDPPTQTGTPQPTDTPPTSTAQPTNTLVPPPAPTKQPTPTPVPAPTKQATPTPVPLPTKQPTPTPVF